MGAFYNFIGVGAFYNFIELHLNLYLSKFKHICVNWRRNIIPLSYTVACVNLYQSNVPLIWQILVFRTISKFTSRCVSVSSADS